MQNLNSHNMLAVNQMTTSGTRGNADINTANKPLVLTAEDKLAIGHMRYAQGVGPSLRYANELRAVQQVGRLPFLKSSHLHEDVLRGHLSAGAGLHTPFEYNDDE